MAQFTVTPQQMQQVATHINSKIGEWQQAVSKLNSLVVDMNAMWDGTANDSFNAIFSEDQAKFGQLTQLMEEYCIAINTAANNYISGENEVKGIVTRR